MSEYGIPPIMNRIRWETLLKNAFHTLPDWIVRQNPDDPTQYEAIKRYGIGAGGRPIIGSDALVVLQDCLSHYCHDDTPYVFFDDDGTTFWTKAAGGTPSLDTTYFRHGVNSYKVVQGAATSLDIYHNYSSLDLSLKTHIQIWFYKPGTSTTSFIVEFWCQPYASRTDGYRWTFTHNSSDTTNALFRLIQLRKENVETIGSPDVYGGWSNIQCVRIYIPSGITFATLRLDFMTATRVMNYKAVHVSGDLEINHAPNIPDLVQLSLGGILTNTDVSEGCIATTAKNPFNVKHIRITNGQFLTASKIPLILVNPEDTFLYLNTIISGGLPPFRITGNIGKLNGVGFNYLKAGNAFDVNPYPSQSTGDLFISNNAIDVTGAAFYVAYMPATGGEKGYRINFLGNNCIGNGTATAVYFFEGSVDNFINGNIFENFLNAAQLHGAANWWCYRNIISNNKFTNLINKTSGRQTSGAVYCHQNLFRNNPGLNPIGLITNPFGSNSSGNPMVGWEPWENTATAYPISGTVYEVSGCDIILTSLGGDVSDITIWDQDNNEVVSGLTQITTPLWLDYLWKIRWTWPTTAPTVKVFGR